MKKIVSILITVCLILGVGSVFAGCGKNKETGDVIMTLVVGSAAPADTALVEAEVSRIAKEKLGFGVKFKPVSVFELGTQYTNWLGAGDEIDVLGIFFDDAQKYINNKSVREIDSLLTKENAPNVLNLLEETESILNRGNDGKKYGIGVMPETLGRGTAYTVRKDILKKAGLFGTGEGQYQDQQKIDYDDLDIIFKAIKDNAGTTPGTNLPVYPVGNLATSDIAVQMIPADPLGGGSGMAFPTGTLIGTESTTIANYYKSAEYKQFVNKMGEWKAKGYVHPDADTTSATLDTLVKSGQYVGTILDWFSTMRDQWNTTYTIAEEGFIQLWFMDPFYMFSNPGQGWHIPSRSKRPVSAMKLIDLMMSDVEVMNNFLYGVNGVHREWADYDAKILKYPAGVDAKNVGYRVPIGIYGCHNLIGTWPDASLDLSDPAKLQQAVDHKKAVVAEDKIKSDAALANPTKGVGYTYNSTSQAARIKSVKTVIDQYSKTLSIGKGSKGSDGTYTGPGSTYAKFIAALDAAKIDLVIADNQAQFDAWLAKQ